MSESVSGRGFALSMAAVIGLTGGLADAALSVARLPEHYPLDFQTAAALPAASLAIAAVYLVCWFLAVRPVTRLSNVREDRTAVALALTLAVTHLAVLIAELFALGIWPDLDVKLAGRTTFERVVGFGAYAFLALAAFRIAGRVTSTGAAAALLKRAAPWTAASLLWLLAAMLMKSLEFGGAASRMVLSLLVILPALLILPRFGRVWIHPRWLGGLTGGAAVLAAVVFMMGPAELKPETPFTGKTRHVILVTIDTLRQDALSCYNPGTPATPAMDQLANDGILFGRAYTSSPWTLPAMASILTGVTPAVHGLDKKHLSLPQELPSIAERFQQNGYLTIGAETNFWLHRLTDGFREYHTLPEVDPVGLSGLFVRLLVRHHVAWDGDGADLTTFAETWLRRYREQPLFLWLHYLDVHAPYAPPPEYLPRGRKPEGIEEAIDVNLSDFLAGSFFPTAEQAVYLRKLYLAEVQYEDDQIGRLIEILRSEGLYDEALIVLASDHGEEFLEHGGLYHGVTMFDEVLKVPLVVKLPGGSPKGRVDAVVSTRDIAGTMLDLAGIANSSSGARLPSLAHYWNGGAPPTAAPAIAEGMYSMEPTQSLVQGEWKYVRQTVSGRAQLYNLAADPAEERNLAEVEPGKTAALRQQVEGHNVLSQQLRKAYAISQQTASELDRETLGRLKSLGYLR